MFLGAFLLISVNAPPQRVEPMQNPIEVPLTIPQISFGGWYLDDRKLQGTQVAMFYGETIRLDLILSAPSDISGSLKVEFVKDIVGGGDRVVISETQELDLVGGQSRSVSFVVQPDELTENRVRQYFYRVYWNDSRLQTSDDQSEREAFSVLRRPAVDVQEEPAIEEEEVNELMSERIEAIRLVQGYRGADETGSTIVETIVTMIVLAYPDEDILDNPGTEFGWIALWKPALGDDVYEVRFDFKTYREETSFSFLVDLGTLEVWPANELGSDVLEIVDGF